MKPRAGFVGVALIAFLALEAVAAVPVPSAVVPATGMPVAAEDDSSVGNAGADTTLGGFLRNLSDSTDRYFGLSAVEPDTTGLDSALAYGLAHPDAGQRGLLRPSLLPDFAFNRVDGPVWGGILGVGDARRLVRLTGNLKYAAGPNVWLGGGELQKVLRRRDDAWSLRVFAGRLTTGMDRDYYERHLATFRALIAGKDYKHYSRRDGLEARIEREAATVRLAAGYRDMLESPLVTTTTWNFARRDPVVLENLPAARGRVREFSLEAGWRLPLVPVRAEIIHHTSGQAIGSDFEYRRTRLAASGDFGLGAVASLVPQVVYGRLTESAPPQASFYLGGSHTLRSLRSASRGGTGMALARLDVVGTADVLEWAHIPHPAALPIQAGLFTAIGAVWGVDPYGGPAVPGDHWPHREAWLSEVGVSLLYQPGIPDPTGLFRLNYAWPLGPDRLGSRWTFAYTRAFDLLRLFRP